MDLKKSGSFTCGGDAKVAPADSTTSANDRQSPKRLRQRANTHDSVRAGAESSRTGGSEELDWSRTRSGADSDDSFRSGNGSFQSSRADRNANSTADADDDDAVRSVPAGESEVELADTFRALFKAVKRAVDDAERRLQPQLDRVAWLSRENARLSSENGRLKLGAAGFPVRCDK